MATLLSWARRAGLLAAACGVMLLPHLPAEASAIGQTRMVIDFRDGRQAAARARWDDMDIVQCGPAGLGWGGTKTEDERTFRPSTLVTIESLGIGASWRPTRNADVTVKITWTGEVAARAHGTLWVRYGCDGEHWSEWRDVPQVQDERPGAVKTHRTRLRVPSTEQLWYDVLIAEYAKEDVPWKSDEEAAVEWILEKHPDLFEHVRPFLGYLEFRYETEFPGGTRIESLDASVVWVLPGPHHAPKDPKARDGRDGPWRWRADYSHEPVADFDRAAETKAVYEAVLRAAVAYAQQPGRGLDGPLQRVVVESSTSAGPEFLGMDLKRLEAFRSRVPKLPLPLLRSFEDVNNRTQWVPAGMDIGVPVVLVAWSRYWRFRMRLGDQEWHAFDRRWPGSAGWLTLSAIGFDRAEGGAMQALVHVGRTYGYLAGYGTLYVLAREEGTWHITRAIPTWVS